MVGEPSVTIGVVTINFLIVIAAQHIHVGRASTRWDLPSRTATLRIWLSYQVVSTVALNSMILITLSATVTAVTPAPSGQGLVSQQLSVAWPVRAVSEGEMLTRDYLQGRHYATVADDSADSKAESGAIEVEPRSKEALQRDLTASLLSIGLMRTEHLSSGNAQSKMSDDESPVERVLNQSYKALQSSFLTPSLEPTMGTMGSKPQSYTIAASDHFDLRDFSNTSKSFEDSKKPVSGPLKPTVLPQWSAALNRLDEIRENGLPLKIYMDKKVYLWGQLAEPLPCDASAEELATDPSWGCPIVLVDSPEEADVLYLIDHTYR